jgi:1-acyl-sn-glycerol-3-phosphate acyltransferase
VLILRLTIAGLLVTATAIAILPLAAVTGFVARRLYSAIVKQLARVLLLIWGVRVRVHQDRPFPGTQTVYVSNHSSTLDLFVLVALGLPNTRFFLSGFLQQYVPLGILARLMGTFFTVPQDRPADRRRIFASAAETLRRTRESVYLSPEGMRVTGGDIGAFNKGAFHLATSLRAPIVPLYFFIPRAIDPGIGFNANAGVVDVFVKPPIDTRDWRLDDLVANKEAVRDRFVAWHREAHREEARASDTSLPAEAAAALAR